MSDSFALAIPEPSAGQLVPAGWAINVLAPALEHATWEDLDDAEARLKALTSLAESYKQDRLEFDKAMRIVEYRRGVMLGPPVRGRPPNNVPSVEHFPEESRASLSRWRTIADHWDAVVWPLILRATTWREVSQAAILRLIEGQKPATNGPKPAPVTERWTPTPRPGPSESPEDMARTVVDRATSRAQPEAKPAPPEELPAPRPDPYVLLRDIREALGCATDAEILPAIQRLRAVENETLASARLGQ